MFGGQDGNGPLGGLTAAAAAVLAADRSPGPGRPSVPACFSLPQVQRHRLLVTVARSRSSSALASASAACSAVIPGRPGTDADSASSAPCLAIRQMCTTVDRSAFHFAAASRCVACPVSTDTNNSYFSLGDSRRGLREFVIQSDKMIRLQTGPTRRLVAGISKIGRVARGNLTPGLPQIPA